MRAWEAAEAEKGVSALELIESRTVPHPIAGEGDEPPTVTVKIAAAAINPVDYHVLGAMGAMVHSWPYVTGCDMAGTVAEAASGSKWKVGDRVWACTDIGAPHSGTFAEYCRVPDDMLGSVADGVAFADASTLGVGCLTAALALYYHMGLSIGEGAGSTSEAVLIYGASSSVGCYAVQLAKLSGYRVVAVASTRNHGYMKELGAHQTVDYKDSDWVDQIAAEGANKGMRRALVAVCSGGATGKSFQVLEKCGGEGVIVTATLPKVMLGDDVQDKPDSELVCITLPTVYHDAQRPVAAGYVTQISEWVAAGKVKPNRVRVAGGLEAAKEALQELQDGKVSAEKLVVKVCE